VVVLGVAVALFVLSGLLRTARTPRGRGAAKHETDLDDADDVEAILKKHGI
jgi:hypothetical protein